MKIKVGIIVAVDKLNVLSNNLRLNEISILTFSQFYFKMNGSQLEIVVKATYGLHPNEYFEILDLTYLGRNLVTRCFGFIQIPEARMRSKACHFQ